jgi:nucleoside-diphosphate-sugar epimerase
MGTTLVTGAGLVGTSFGQVALRRGENLVYFDPQPRREFLEMKLGKGNFQVVQKDVRDLPALIEAIQSHKAQTVVHTAGLIGSRVAESLYTGFHINVVGTMNVAEAVRLTDVKRMIHISTFGVYDWRKEASEPLTEDFYKGSGVPYGNSKVAKELLLEAYQRMHKLELVVIRPANVYGLGHFWSGSGGGEKIQALLVRRRRFPKNKRWPSNTFIARTSGAPLIWRRLFPSPRKTLSISARAKLRNSRKSLRLSKNSCRSVL